MNIPFRYVSLAVLLLAAFSCGKESAVSGPSSDHGLQAAGSDILCTVAPESKTSLNDILQVIWEPQDRIRVVSADDTEGASYHIKELSEDCRTAVFTTEDAPVAGDVRYAVYPESSLKSYDAKEQKMTLSFPKSSMISDLPMVASSQGSLFAFENLFGGIVVRPYDIQNSGICIKSVSVTSKDGRAIGSDATVDLKTMKVTAFEGKDMSVTMTLDEPQEISSGGWTSWSTHASAAFACKEFSVLVPCGDYPSGLEVSLTDTKGRSYTFETGALTVSEGVLTPMPYMPLTTYYGSVNCVRVAPQTTSVQVDVTPYYTIDKAFTHKGLKVQSSSSVVSSAQVVWQQEYGSKAEDVMATAQSGTVIPSGSTLALDNTEDGKILLTVPLTGAAGNALVAIKDSEGTVLWSFHIWVSDALDVPCNTSEGGQYTLMDRNLGATSVNDRSMTTEELIRNSFGLFYQWGRKDPFPRLVHRTARVTANSYSANLPYTNSVLRGDRTIGSIAYTLRNPDHRIWMDNGSGCNWLTSYVSELWGFHYSNVSLDRMVTENQRKDGVKTVYDPCPAGYRVADIKHIKGIVELNNGRLASRDKYYGYHFDTGASTTTYIPASGWVRSLYDDDKALCYEGFWGMLWSSASAVSNTHYLYLHSASKAEFGDSHVCVRGNMCPVRCVKIKL